VRRFPALLIVLTAFLGACGAARPGAEARQVDVAGVALSPDWVVDRAGILSPGAEKILVGRLTALQYETGDQLVVVTLPSLGGEPIEAVGQKIGNGWGLGQAGRDNGVLLVVAPAERKVRIETGKGLASRLSDSRAREIIDRDLLPRFRDKDMEKGIIAGVDAIGASLRASAPSASERKSS
jgi:uncharacterized protein